MTYRIATVDIAVIVLYLAAIAFLGIYQAVKVRSAGDYFAGGRRFNKFFMMMHALGTGTHADDPVNVTGASFQHGLSGVWYTYVYLLVTPFFWIMAPFFRRSRFLTTADFFRARYSHGLAVLYACMGVMTFVVTIAAMLKGTATIAEAVSGGRVSQMGAILVMTLVFVAYGFAGGLIATVVTESVQGLLIVVMSLLLVPFGLHQIGGFSGLHHALPEHMFRLTALEELTPAWIAAGFVMNLLGIVAQPSAMEVFATGKSEFEGRVGYTYGNMIKRFCAMGWVFTGLIVAAIVAQDPAVGGLVQQHRENAFGWAIARLLPEGFTGLMIAAVLAAQMSSLSAFMVAASALASHNLYRTLLRPHASDRQVLLVGRFAGLVVVAAGVLVASSLGSVAQAVTLFWGVTTLTGVLIWGGTVWKRANVPGAWAAFVVMLVLWATLGPAGKLVASHMADAPLWLGQFAGPKNLPALALRYLPVGIAVFVIVSVLTRPEPASKLDRFYLLITTPVGQEGRLTEAGVPVIYAGETQAHPWETKHPKLVHWGGFIVTALVCLAVLGILVGLGQIGK